MCVLPYRSECIPWWIQLAKYDLSLIKQLHVWMNREAHKNKTNSFLAQAAIFTAFQARLKDGEISELQKKKLAKRCDGLAQPLTVCCFVSLIQLYQYPGFSACCKEKEPSFSSDLDEGRLFSGYWLAHLLRSPLCKVGLLTLPFYHNMVWPRSVLVGWYHIWTEHCGEKKTKTPRIVSIPTDVPSLWLMESGSPFLLLCWLRMVSSVTASPWQLDRTLDPTPGAKGGTGMIQFQCRLLATELKGLMPWADSSKSERKYSNQTKP